MTRLLLDSGAVDLRDYHEKTAIMGACQKGHYEIVQCYWKQEQR